ncbi:MAG: T9SS type A sorting domain-containing protein [Flavipsychrobacter sp.]
MSYRFLPILLVLLLPYSAYCQVGRLDSSFGEHGIVTDSFLTTSLDNDMFKTIALGNGKILMLGNVLKDTLEELGIRRYQADGTVDRSFGTDGTAYCRLGRNIYLTGAALQSDGKIVVAGYRETDFINYVYDLAVARINADGTLDSSFGNNGVTIGMKPSHFLCLFGSKPLIQADGRIVIAGQAVDSNFSFSWALLRVNANGSPDISFGKNGLFTKSFGSFDDMLNDATILQSGKIALAGNYNFGRIYKAVIMRINTNGIIDSTFGHDGVVTYSYDSSAYGYGIIEQPDKKLIGVVETYDTSMHPAYWLDYYLHRLNENGSADSTWGENGITSTYFYPNQNPCFMDIKSTGKLIFGGVSTIAPGTNGFTYVVARFNANGYIDSSFGTDGSTDVAISGSGFYTVDKTRDMAIDLYSKSIILGGLSTTSDPRKNINLMKFKLEENASVQSVHSAFTSVYAYPVPTNSKTKIYFSLNTSIRISALLYDMSGRIIKVISLSKNFAVGKHEMDVDMDDLQAGNYIITLQTSFEKKSIAIIKN